MNCKAVFSISILLNFQNIYSMSFSHSLRRSLSAPQLNLNEITDSDSDSSFEIDIKGKKRAEPNIGLLNISDIKTENVVDQTEAVGSSKLKYLVNELCFDQNTAEEINDIIKMLRNPKPSAFHGIIFYGPPGVGKSTIVEIIAKKTGYELIKKNGTEFVATYAGSGPKAIKETFEQAKKLDKPVIIFVDEFDAFANIDIKRDVPDYHNTATEFQLMLDECDKNFENIFVFAATNYREKINKSLGSRFHAIKLNLPNQDQRQHIIQIHAKKYDSIIVPQLVEKFAHLTSDWSGRDLELMVRYASIKSDAYHLQEKELYESFCKRKKEKRDEQSKDIETILSHRTHTFQVGMGLLGFATAATGLIMQQRHNSQQMAFQLQQAERQTALQYKLANRQIFVSVGTTILSCAVSWLAAPQIAISIGSKISREKIVEYTKKLFDIFKK